MPGDVHIKAQRLQVPTRVVVYGEADDLASARETQIACAFYVPRQQIVAALPAYLDAELPPQDLGYPRASSMDSHARTFLQRSLPWRGPRMLVSTNSDRAAHYHGQIGNPAL